MATNNFDYRQYSPDVKLQYEQIGGSGRGGSSGGLNPEMLKGAKKLYDKYTSSTPSADDPTGVGGNSVRGAYDPNGGNLDLGNIDNTYGGGDFGGWDASSFADSAGPALEEGGNWLAEMAPAAVEALAKGGPVRGRGTSTSDSIPARLSNGEYVLNAEAVKLIGKDKLDILNKQGLKLRGGAKHTPPNHFANGGFMDFGNFAGGMAQGLQQGFRLGKDMKDFRDEQEMKDKLKGLDDWKDVAVESEAPDTTASYDMAGGEAQPMKTVTKHTYGGQVQDTAFTPQQQEAIRTKAMSKIVSGYDPIKGMQLGLTAAQLQGAEREQRRADQEDEINARHDGIQAMIDAGDIEGAIKAAKSTHMKYNAQEGTFNDGNVINVAEPNEQGVRYAYTHDAKGNIIKAEPITLEALRAASDRARDAELSHLSAAHRMEARKMALAEGKEASEAGLRLKQGSYYDAHGDYFAGALANQRAELGLKRDALTQSKAGNPIMGYDADNNPIMMVPVSDRQGNVALKTLKTDPGVKFTPKVTGEKTGKPLQAKYDPNTGEVTYTGDATDVHNHMMEVDPAYRLKHTAESTPAPTAAPSGNNNRGGGLPTVPTLVKGRDSYMVSMPGRGTVTPQEYERLTGNNWVDLMK